MSKDLHAEPFDEGTITKLDIFEQYAKEWLPTFLTQNHIHTLAIFDFFAGTGYDLQGIAGSPIRILKQLTNYNNLLSGKKIILYFNEFQLDKFRLLKQACMDYLDEHKELKASITIHYYNEDFDNLFFKLIDDIRKYPSLVYLDQNGIKYISNKYLLKLENIKQTDFLYFTSSSYFLRFSERDEFKTHVNIDISAAKAQPKSIHRVVTEELRKKLPNNTRLRLYPFAIEKKSNIYGIIFGASHARAVDKFLKLAWNKNSINGEANFDVDNDILKDKQFDIFEGKQLTKIERFYQTVETKILNKEITNNIELYYFTLENGHIPKHSSDCLKNMKKNGKITFDGYSPLITFENIKDNKIIHYKVLQNEIQ